jgi:hypothetical protein
MEKITTVAGGDKYHIRRTFKADFERLVAGEIKTTDDDGEEIELSYEALEAVMDVFGCNKAVFEGLFNDMTLGITKFLWTERVLRGIKVTTKDSDIRASKENINRIYTTTGLWQVAEPGIDAKTRDDMPEGYWLKMEPKRKRIERAKWEIVQEYWFADRYSTFIYGSPIA